MGRTWGAVSRGEECLHNVYMYAYVFSPNKHVVLSETVNLLSQNEQLRCFPSGACASCAWSSTQRPTKLVHC